MMCRKAYQLLAIAMLLWAVRLNAQETHLVSGTAGFPWPQTQPSSVRANTLPKEKIESFLNSLRARVPGYEPIRIGEFRFVPLERDRFYLVASYSGRIESITDAVAPVRDRYQYTEIESHNPFPLAMQAADLGGDGVDELVTAEWPAGYLGASTPSIYWYTVWRFQDGLPQDASARFPEFYRSFVLGQFSYIDQLLSRLQSVDPESVRVPLEEIEYVRLKFQRVVIGQRNAGLEQALAWAKSDNGSLRMMGMSSLAEMPAEAAGDELAQLARSPAMADLARAFLTRRARLLGKGPSEQQAK